MEWIIPKTNWTPDDYYNFEDLNRLEHNTVVVAELISHFNTVPNIEVVTTRDIKYIEFAESLNRIERNQELLKKSYTPSNWIENKTDWKANSPFDYNDAARLEINLALLYAFYKGNASAFKRCGSYICGEEVI